MGVEAWWAKESLYFRNKVSYMKKYLVSIFASFLFGIETIPAQYNILHNFNDTNGAQPSGSLIIAEGVLYLSLIHI